ncbi:YncE family protein [Pseudomonas nunensis]|uniref:YncE family protein n=1 Tax=Pseudomonas nunensis TaxID=2961896 RepID=UPI0006B3FE62|nr:YncE family protein [Pseudomonas nunensis]
MPTTPSSDDTVLVLYPPRMPGATTPVIGAHYGVPKRIYDLEPMGAKVEVNPYPDQEAGDTVFLNLDEYNGIDSRQTQSDSDTVVLYIPKNMLKQDTLHKLSYSVVRGSQNRGTSEPLLELLYNLVRPGNQDRAPGPGENDGHSELELLLPDEIKDGVGPDFPVAGVPVCVSYPFCRAYDRIRLNLNGHDVYHTVTPLEAPLPGSATPVKVCFTVTRADLAAGGDPPQFNISYTLTDQCGNGPDPDAPWSASQVVDVDLAGRQLVAPDLAEDPDDPSDDPATIDLIKLGTKDLTVSVQTFAPVWQVNDRIRVAYTATPPTGPVADQLITADVTRVPFTYKLMVDNAKVLPNSVVRARYELVRNNVVIATSRTAIARVIGEGAVELRPPFLFGATSPIDVLAYPDGVTVRVEHLTAESGDKAHLVEVSPLPDTPAFPSPVLNANHRANFNLSLAFLAARQGRVVELKWDLIRNGAKVAESPVLALTVNRIVDGDTRLPTPTITAVTDGVTLDLTSFTGDTSALVQAWLGIAVGQLFWLRCEGTTSTGAPVTLPIHRGTAIGSTGDQSGDVTRALLDQLADGSQINVFATVNFDGVANEATAVKFPVRTYAVKTAPAVKLVFTNGPYKVAPAARLKDITLLLTTPDDVPISQGRVLLTLPSGAKYADGGSGEREFRTETNGTLTIHEVVGGIAPGSFSLIAATGTVTSQALLTIISLGSSTTIPGAHQYIAISPDGLRAFTTDVENSLVSVVDLETNTVTDRITTPVKPTKIRFNKSGTHVYFIYERGVAIIDSRTLRVVENIVISSSTIMRDITASHDGRFFYACGATTITVIDANTMKVVRSFSVSRNATAITITPDDSHLYIFSSISSEVNDLLFIANANSGQTIKTLTVGSSSQSAVFSPDGRRGFFCSWHSHLISDLDTQSMSIPRTISITYPSCLALTPNGEQLYVCINNGTCNIFDALTLQKQQTIPTGISYMMDIEFSHDGSRCYICNYGIFVLNTKQTQITNGETQP